ncbi:hypothetical protein [Agromyces mariniharenae]|uniref:Uncharacterized protein n=1 Tax=Agromyces mariniharenae TaxID=2604423 RepID=A0A5S4UWA1_9MICO|nr:hypothetical protein [Agromyces mariniharenae]TYL50832.1 hypothetical protein FYC51_16930 [Agromyces mariniharenae]
MSTARTVGASLFIAAFLTTAIAAPASARPEAAPDAPPTQSHGFGQCPLQRIDDQFVRCDDLTGAGVRAPSWIPEQHARFF